MEKCKLTVINIRGTSGSGKTTVVRNILNHGNWQSFKDEKTNKIRGYFSPDLHWAIVGSYENDCGGCDTIKHQVEVEDLVEKLLDSQYNVVFEGLLISTISQRWIDFSKRLSQKATIVFCYLTTPVEECVNRVKQRRWSKGNMKDFNETNTVERVKAIETTYQKLTAAGCYTYKASQKELTEQLYKWYGIGG